MMSSELVTPGTEYAPSDTASRLLVANVHIAPCKLQNNFSFFPSQFILSITDTFILSAVFM